MDIDNLNIRQRLRRIIMCPKCGSRYSYARLKTKDRVCRRCSTIFITDPNGDTYVADEAIDKEHDV